MSQNKRREIFAEINITPLTDIFLVLLIIMMVIAPMLDSQGLSLAVPTVSANKSVTEDPKVISVAVTDAGAYTVDNEPVDPKALQGRLKQLKPSKPEGMVIEPSPNSEHGAVVIVMDAARAAGIEKIAVSGAAE